MEHDSRRSPAALPARRFAARFSLAARSKVRSSHTSACTHLLHQWLAIRRHFKATNPISAASVTETASTITQRSLQKRHRRETTCECKCNIAVAHLFSSDSNTLQSPRASRFSRPGLIDPKKKMNASLWECTSHTTRPTRMTRSTLLRQEGPSCHNRVHSIPTCTTAYNPSRSRDPEHSRAGIRRCRDMRNRVKRTSAEFT